MKKSWLLISQVFFSSSTRMRLQSGSFAQCRHVCGVKALMSLCRVSGCEMEIPLRSPWTLGCTGRMTCCGSSQLMHGVGLSSVLCLAFMAVTSLSSEAHISVCVLRLNGSGRHKTMKLVDYCGETY